MGKFFDAMQRAARGENARGETGSSPNNALPELDDALLQPEGPDGDVFGDPVGANHDSPRRDLNNAETPSGVIRTLESELHAAKVGAKTAEKSQPAKPPGRPPIQVKSPHAGPAPSLKTQPIEPVKDIREPAATVVRVHPAYDRIVQRLLTYRRTPRQSVVLMTSAVSGEGTSTVARNVAMALSQAGTEQILLVDANLRTPSQHDAFCVSRAGGFGEVLQGELALASAIHDDLGSGIAVMTSGLPVKSPSQVLKASAVQGTMMALLSLYDWIILDSPPATVYPDVASLGTACGASLLVVCAEKTRSEVVEEAKFILEGTGTDLLGAVLNRRKFHIPGAIYRRL